MSTYKLSYFNDRGRAEVARLLFVKSGTEFEDNRIEYYLKDEWSEFKAKTSKYITRYLLIIHCLGSLESHNSWVH